MQALIILSLIAFHLLDQLVGGQPVAGVAWRVAAVPLVCLLGPVALGLQSLWSSRAQTVAHDQRRSDQWAMGLWFLSGLLLIAGINWGSLIRHQFQLAAWTPLDEVLLFTPLLLSLLLCWWVQFQVELPRGSQRFAAAEVRRLRRGFVGIRARVFLAPALVPLGAIIAAQALGNGIAAVIGSAATAAWITLGLLLLFLALLPRFFAVVWRTRPLAPGPLRDALAAAAESRGVRFREIRVWPTENQLANALVVGILPRARMLILTDRLIRLLDLQELCVVVAHEASHVRLRHLLTRVGFVLLPIIAVSLVAWGLTAIPGQRSDLRLLGEGEIDPLWSTIAAALYSIYAFGMISWISRNMEHQADLYACQMLGKNENRQLDMGSTCALGESLIALASDSGEDIQRSGWLHPSTARRVEFLRRAVDDPALARSFERSFARAKLCLVVAVCIAALAIGLL